ncbi:hypothetical protein M1506_03720 [Patescibacteria group bacterium]|nr:hypothetical protein [Patescibacteria group bacterium]
MKFKEIIKRLNGISTPVFGISWNPNQTDRDLAKEVISFLEDRRVLYNPSEMEMPDHCVQSVLEIRRFLTQKIGIAQDNNPVDSLRAMRASCRKFLDTVGADKDIVQYGHHHGHWASWTFNGALGELRGVFGIHVARIATMYGLDVEEDLATILPAADDEKASL